jgi:hypothetical protein
MKASKKNKKILGSKVKTAQKMDVGCPNYFNQDLSFK